MPSNSAASSPWDTSTCSSTCTRQGPDNAPRTASALHLSCLDGAAPVRVADMGCSTGASTLALVRLLPRAYITAVDCFSTFLSQLRRRAEAAGLDALLTRHAHSEAVHAVVTEHEQKIALNEKHKAHFGHGFYVAQKAP